MEKRRNIIREKKRIIFIIAAILIIFIIVISNTANNKKDEEVATDVTNKEIYVKEIEDEIKINTSNKLNEAKEVDGLQITNIQLTTKDGMTTLLADVTNKSGAKTQLKTVQVTLLNSNSEELVNLTGIIGELEPEEKTQLNISMTADYINAYDFKVKVK